MNQYYDNLGFQEFRSQVGIFLWVENFTYVNLESHNSSNEAMQQQFWVQVFRS
jgi:hypothetical protein